MAGATQTHTQTKTRLVAWSAEAVSIQLELVQFTQEDRAGLAAAELAESYAAGGPCRGAHLASQRRPLTMSGT
jgi:hypothetical protein